MADFRRKVDQRSMSLIGFFFISLSGFFLIYLPGKISGNTALYHQLIEAREEVILQDTGFLFYYGGWLVLISILLMGFYSLFLALKGERPPRSTDKKITRGIGYAIISGFILMISGKFVAQFYWTSTFEQAGYMQCDNSFGMTQSWTTRVWALNPGSCETPFDPHAIRQKQADIARR